MTDRERYQRTFSVLHASAELKTEDTEMEMKMTMNKTKKRHITKLTAVCAAAAAAVCMGTTAAYAANVGGIQRQVQIWLHGDKTDAVMTIEQGEHSTHYTVAYEDDSGEVHEVHGGGVAMDGFGNEIPLTEEEVMEELDSPNVVVGEDGTMIVYYHDKSIDITDDFDEEGYCYVQVENEETDETYYLRVEKDGGYSMSTDKYPDRD